MFDINKKKSMLVLGPHGKDRKYSKDKANTDTPKLSRGLPPPTANRTLADCGENTHGTSVQHTPLAVYHPGGVNALLSLMIITKYNIRKDTDGLHNIISSDYTREILYDFPKYKRSKLHFSGMAYCTSNPYFWSLDRTALRYNIAFGPGSKS